MEWLFFVLNLWGLVPHCPRDMANVGPFCMDQFEAPNIRGSFPLVMQSFDDAERWCSARQKRVCSEDEWSRACRGMARPVEDRTVCNNGKDWMPFDIDRYAGWKTQAAEVARLFQGSPSGSFEGCRTPEGVYDLDGNVEEWVRARGSRPMKAVLKGGFWAKGWPQCWEVNDAHEATFRFYETGFRCCRDVSVMYMGP